MNIVYAFRIKNYVVLKLQGEMPKTAYSQYVIDGIPYSIVPIYDVPKCIAIETQEPADDFVSKTVIFK